LPLGLDKSLQDSLGAVSHAIKGLSFGGVQIWVLTSFIMGLLPVTAVVDAAYAIKQYIRDGQIAGRTGLVGEEARVRIANALNEIHKEQGSTNGPTYTRITFLSYSFGTIPTIEALSTYRADLRAPVRLITLGAPITFVGALRPAITETARSFIETGKAPGGSSLASWLCFWSPLDYMSSDPADISNTKWSGFSSNPLKGSRSLWLSHNHDLYFDDDDVAKAILEHSCNAPALPASAQ
jgi:hypothetical protein